MRITGFLFADEDVSAPGPVVETGANVTRLQWRLGRLRRCFVSAARGNWRARQFFLFFRLHFSELYLFAVFL
jgi:hypothetical protein